MISVIISKDDLCNNKIQIKNKKDINHLKNVFRIKVDDDVRAVDGEKEYFCTVSLLEKDLIILDVKKINTDKESTDNSIKLHMGISIIKNEKFDMEIQKLTELGVDTIIPIITKRVIVKIKDEDKKREKWYSIIKETLKQCQGIKGPIIEPIQELQDIQYDKYDLLVVPYEEAKNTRIKDIIKDIDNIHDIFCIIGPEGGFEEAEIEFLKNKNGKIITLGNRILRAETAAIVTGGIILNEIR